MELVAMVIKEVKNKIHHHENVKNKMHCDYKIKFLKVWNFLIL